MPTKYSYTKRSHYCSLRIANSVFENYPSRPPHSIRQEEFVSVFVKFSINGPITVPIFITTADK